MKHLFFKLRSLMFPMHAHYCTHEADAPAIHTRYCAQVTKNGAPGCTDMWDCRGLWCKRKQGKWCVYCLEAEMRLW